MQVFWGEAVFFCDYRLNNNPTWLKGVVSKMSGKQT